MSPPAAGSEGNAVDLPYVISSDRPGESLTNRIAAERPQIRQRLRTDGAVLLRGFDVGGVDGFEAAVRVLSGDPLPYAERSSPRSTIKGRIYTSTDYPPTEEIFFHNENSYQSSWPMTLYFHCLQPPLERGATPLADTRAVLRELDPQVLEEFTRRRWMVRRNFTPDVGLPWQKVFDTTDRDQVTRYCAEHGIEAQWRGQDWLRTTSVRDAVHRHPHTGERVWFNHAAIFHVTTLGPDVRAGLLEMFGEDGLPSNSYFGDGGAIPDDVIGHVRDCYRAAGTRFDYQRDDVLVIDNMLTAHAREPFRGPRRIAVAMAEPVTTVETPS
ncbi:TauD/TfdA family dioxygenase [Micromonospora wenchangensis]